MGILGEIAASIKDGGVITGAIILTVLLLTQEPKWRLRILGALALLDTLAFAGVYSVWSYTPPMPPFGPSDARQGGVEIAGVILLTLAGLGVWRLYKGPATAR